MATWWPAVYDDGLPTEWWLVSEDGHLVRSLPAPPGTVPMAPHVERLSREVTDPHACRRRERGSPC